MGKRAVKLVLALVLLAIAVPGWFRIAALWRESTPAHELAPSEGRYVEVEGRGLFIEELGPATGRPVVMIHGAMAWSGTFRPLMERLAASGYRAIAVDVPPFGFSDRPSTHDYDRRAQARRIGALLDALALTNVVMLGHSFGAGATVETAMTRRDRVTGLVLLSGALGLAELASPAPIAPPAPITIGPVRDGLVATIATNPWTTGAVLRSMMENDAVVTDARIAVYQQPFGVEGLTTGVGDWMISGLFADEHAATSAAEASYRAYAPPVLLVWGSGDTVTPVAQAQSLSDWLPSDELVVLDRVGHIPHVEDLDGVSSTVIDWLGRHAR